MENSQEKNISMHKLITTMFNPRLNDFISEQLPDKKIGTVIGGGRFDADIHIDKQYVSDAYWLSEFRDRITLKQTKGTENQNIRNELTPLIDFYLKIFFERKRTDYLNTKLVQPIKNIFRDVDRELGSNYFQETAREKGRLTLFKRLLFNPASILVLLLTTYLLLLIGIEGKFNQTVFGFDIVAFVAILIYSVFRIMSFENEIAFD
jgi:hypothetical protein